MNTVTRSFFSQTRGHSLSWNQSHTSIRSLSCSATAAKALPFSLKTFGKDHEESERGQHLRMLMFGKPGAGKGTLSARLTQNYDISFLSTGDLLRHEIAEKSEVGRLAEEIVANGGLLSDDIMIRVITSKLDLLSDKHWILDGFPRTLGQGELLDSHLRNAGNPLSLIVNLDVPDEVILNRISDRWVHLPSGRVYNLSYNRPRVEGRDDVTGEPLSKRPDDNPEIFSRRLKRFYESTSPLISYYASRVSPLTNMVTLSGSTSDEIWPKLERVVKESFPIRSRTDARERERDRSLREAVSLNNSQERDRMKTKPDLSPR
ncbi:ADK-domain-containing protein [Ramaria rubella]|nr:ADK-domain-containing protein [Ramaria rubella]